MSKAQLKIASNHMFSVVRITYYELCTTTQVIIKLFSNISISSCSCQFLSAFYSVGFSCNYTYRFF